MWEQQIEKMKKELAMWGTTVNEPATDEELARFASAAKNVLGVEIPKEHLDFLKEINGLNNNGYFIFNIDEEYLDNDLIQKVGGFISRNGDLAVGETERWIYIAESECWVYAYRVADKSYYQLDDLIMDIHKKYGSHAEMINEIIDESMK